VSETICDFCGAVIPEGTVHPGVGALDFCDSICRARYDGEHALDAEMTSMDEDARNIWKGFHGGITDAD